MRIWLSVDITTGDAITPRAINYPFRLLFENRSISLTAYNTETILAAKIEKVMQKLYG
jgi:hypothetical protein